MPEVMPGGPQIQPWERAMWAAMWAAMWRLPAVSFATADERWSRTVPGARKARRAMSATGAPSEARESRSASRAVRGESPAAMASVPGHLEVQDGDVGRYRLRLPGDRPGEHRRHGPHRDGQRPPGRGLHRVHGAPGSGAAGRFVLS